MIALPVKHKCIRLFVRKAEFRKGPAGMSEKEQLIQGLSDAGCNEEAAERISRLFEAGSYDEDLHQMKVQQCTLVEQMHESQRKVDYMDFLIRKQEKQIKK